MIGYMQVTIADHEANEFRCLGGAGFLTMAETRRRFAAIPHAPKPAPDAPFALVLDLMTADSIVDDKYVSVETAEALLGPEAVAGLTMRMGGR